MNKTATLKVGDKVRLTKATRHKMIPAGEVGRVVEIRDDGKFGGRLDGVTVEFMRKPDPRIARIFGADPNVAEPFLCLFPKGGRLPLVRVS